jgi:hypothetical protein
MKRDLEGSSNFQDSYKLQFYEIFETFSISTELRRNKNKTQIKTNAQG